MKPRKVDKVEYTVVSFRVAKSDAEWIESKVVTLLDRLNGQLLEDEARFTKGELFAEIIRLGMPYVKLDRRAG